ncbi:MAG: hypothetical protein QOD31_2328 [Pseudonocardiales bacterium]|nr:hypothetical protein [Pseudonocardiales bacterium]
MSDGVSWAAVSARRLQRHGLATPLADATPAEVAARMCGTHAQIPSAAELSIGLRLATGTRADVRAALWDERSLVKTFGPRGTVHLLPAAQLPMWTGALSALPMLPHSFAADIRLSPEETDAVVAAVATAVDGAELSIDELSDAVVDIAGPWAGERVMPAFQEMWPRWRQAVTTAAHRGAVCFGPNRGRNVTYTSPRRWLPGFTPADGRPALAELLRTYLHSYGPATPAQFARWLNAPRQWATELFDSLSGELERVQLAGTPAWVCAGDAAVPPAEPEGVRLLPYFDAYVVGGQPRELLYPGRAAERALTGGQAGNVPVVLIDGTVAGVWHQRRSGRKIAVTVEPFGRLSAARRRELEEQVERVGQILEAEPTMTIGPVTVGPHA